MSNESVKDQEQALTEDLTKFSEEWSDEAVAKRVEELAEDLRSGALSAEHIVARGDMTEEEHRLAAAEKAGGSIFFSVAAETFDWTELAASSYSTASGASETPKSSEPNILGRGLGR